MVTLMQPNSVQRHGKRRWTEWFVIGFPGLIGVLKRLVKKRLYRTTVKENMKWPAVVTSELWLRSLIYIVYDDEVLKIPEWFVKCNTNFNERNNTLKVCLRSSIWSDNPHRIVYIQFNVSLPYSIRFWYLV